MPFYTVSARQGDLWVGNQYVSNAQPLLVTELTDALLKAYNQQLVTINPTPQPRLFDGPAYCGPVVNNFNIQLTDSQVQTLAQGSFRGDFSIIEVEECRPLPRIEYSRQPVYPVIR